jgi:hypothetical protein
MKTSISARGPCSFCPLGPHLYHQDNAIIIENKGVGHVIEGAPVGPHPAAALDSGGGTRARGSPAPVGRDVAFVDARDRTDDFISILWVGQCCATTWSAGGRWRCCGRKTRLAAGERKCQNPVWWRRVHTVASSSIDCGSSWQPVPCFSPSFSPCSALAAVISSASPLSSCDHKHCSVADTKTGAAHHRP